MRTKRYLAGATAAIIAIAAAAGCAGQIKKLEPKLELRDAAQHLADAGRAGFTLRLTGNADDLIAAYAPDDATAGDKAMMRTLFHSSVTIAYDKAGAGTDDDRAALAATVDGVAGTEIRVVGKTLYAKAPVAGLAAKFGAAGDVGDLRKEAASETPGLEALFDGKWIAIDLQDAANTAGLPSPGTDPEKTLAEVRKSAQSLAGGATVVRDGADPGHLIVTSSTTKAYAEVKRLVTALAPAGGGGIADELGDAPKDRPIVLDLWVKDGDLTAAELNLLQFADGATGRAALRLEVTTGAPISAPPGATKVTPPAAVADDKPRHA